ncbi:MAG: hypothetical protein ABIG44_05820, partial [Planctomycetota bacterium]
ARPLTILAGDMSTEEAFTSVQIQMFHFWPKAISAERAELDAAEFQRPATLRYSTGQVATDSLGDMNKDGFNEAYGCYLVGLHEGVARFVFEPGSLPRHNPVFMIPNRFGRRCWVYCDGEALPTDWHDATGNVLFMIPGVIQTSRSIEIQVGDS